METKHPASRTPQARSWMLLIAGLVLIGGLLLSTPGQALPSSSLQASLAIGGWERIEPCSDPVNVNGRCYAVYVRPNVVAHSEWAGQNQAVVSLVGSPSTSNYCNWFVPTEGFNCINDEQATDPNYVRQVVAPGSYFCRSYTATLKNSSLGVIVDATSGTRCVQVFI